MWIQNKIPFYTVKLFSLVFIILLFILITGCEKEEKAKTSSVDFTLVPESDIPKDLKKLIKERYNSPFELSYSDGSYLYVVKGYGKKETSDYNIVVNDFYMSDDTLIFDTDLYGPKENDNVSHKPSYPYIVIKTEYIENSIIFQ